MRRFTILEVCAFVLAGFIFGASVALDIVGHQLSSLGYQTLCEEVGRASMLTKVVLLASFGLCYLAYRLAKRIEERY